MLQDIWDYLRELELTHPAPKPRYMRKQADLNWNARSIVVDWLASVADAYDMCNETLHLSVNYVDRFLSHYAVVRSAENTPNPRKKSITVIGQK